MCLTKARSVVAVLVVSCLVFLPGRVARGQIVSGSWSLDCEAIQGNPDLSDSDSRFDSTFPFLDAISLMAGNSTNDTGYDFDGNALTAYFHNTFDHVRDGSGGSSDLSSGSISFTANGNATYTISGDYNLNGFRGIELSVLLVDVTDPFNEVTLFENAQTSVATTNETFTVGGTGGDDFNLLTGTLTGSLVAGNDYTFLYDFTIYTNLPPDQVGDPPASAAGFLNLDIEAAPVCGNGILESGEECDNGPANSDTTPDACRTDCTLPSCGDDVVDTGEECDNGPANSDTTPDACRTDCTLPSCGDNVTDTGEECDNGPANSDTTPDACRTDCTLPSCGDDVVDTGEECDDGPANSDTTPDACRTDCTLPSCGDNVVDTGEECDDGPANSDTTPNACRTNCELPRCGDQVTDIGEQCDPGPAPSSSCDADCTFATCGDGIVNVAAGEECDGSNDAACPGLCLSDCTCGAPGPEIPTVTEWGLVVMTLLGLIAGTMVFAARRRPRTTD